jgi:hypothetical protein
MWRRYFACGISRLPRLIVITVHRSRNACINHDSTWFPRLALSFCNVFPHPLEFANRGDAPTETPWCSRLRNAIGDGESVPFKMWRICNLPNPCQNSGSPTYVRVSDGQKLNWSDLLKNPRGEKFDAWLSRETRREWKDNRNAAFSWTKNQRLCK